MTSVFACRVSHRIVTSARLSHFLTSFCQKKKFREYLVCLYVNIKYFIIGINKTVVFLKPSQYSFNFANVRLSPILILLRL